MYRKIKRGLNALLVFCLLGGNAWAALPDPVEFGWAVERGDMRSVSAWLDEGLSPDFMGSEVGSGLMIAAWHGNIEMMDLFIRRGANPRRANANGEQPLQLAAWNGHLDAVKWLLDHGANLNREGNYWGALHYAVFNGHAGLAHYLIGRGAEVNAHSPNGSTPLMMAAREGREDIAKVLLEAGADTKVKNDWGDTALTLAMRYEHFQLGKMISTPEDFEIAVKAPKESFGVANRSTPPPTRIEELLLKIREAEGRPSADLHYQLRLAVNAARREAIARRQANRQMPLPYESRSIVITAKRGRPGQERAEVVVGRKPTQPYIPLNRTNRPAAISITPVDERAKQARISQLMQQIRQTEAQGQPADHLRRQLSEAVDSLKP